MRRSKKKSEIVLPSAIPLPQNGNKDSTKIYLSAAIAVRVVVQEVLK